MLVFQNLCKQLYEKIDIVDEERYDCEAKVMKHNSDVSIVRLLPPQTDSACCHYKGMFPGNVV